MGIVRRAIVSCVERLSVNLQRIIHRVCAAWNGVEGSGAWICGEDLSICTAAPMPTADSGGDGTSGRLGNSMLGWVGMAGGVLRGTRVVSSRGRLQLRSARRGVILMFGGGTGVLAAFHSPCGALGNLCRQ